MKIFHLVQQSFDLKNLILAREYYISIRSNNSYHLSEWTDEIITSTLNYLPSSPFYSFSNSILQQKFSLLLLL